MADDELDAPEVDPLEEVLRENARLKAENVRLKKGKPAEKDDELKQAERDSKLSGHRLRVVDNNKKIREIENPPSKGEIPTLKEKLESLELRKKIEDIEHPHKHSWWETRAEHYEKKTKYEKAKHEYHEVHHSSFAINVVIGMVLVGLLLLGLALAFDDNTDPVLQSAQDGVYTVLVWAAGLGVVAFLVSLIIKTARESKPKKKKEGGGGGGHGH